MDSTHNVELAPYTTTLPLLMAMESLCGSECESALNIFKESIAYEDVTQYCRIRLVDCSHEGYTGFSFPAFKIRLELEDGQLVPLDRSTKNTKKIVVRLYSTGLARYVPLTRSADTTALELDMESAEVLVTDVHLVQSLQLSRAVGPYAIHVHIPGSNLYAAHDKINLQTRRSYYNSSKQQPSWAGGATWDTPSASLAETRPVRALPGLSETLQSLAQSVFSINPSPHSNSYAALCNLSDWVGQRSVVTAAFANPPADPRPDCPVSLQLDFPVPFFSETGIGYFHVRLLRADGSQASEVSGLEVELTLCLDDTLLPLNSVCPPTLCPNPSKTVRLHGGAAGVFLRFKRQMKSGKDFTLYATARLGEEVLSAEIALTRITRQVLKQKRECAVSVSQRDAKRQRFSAEAPVRESPEQTCLDVQPLVIHTAEPCPLPTAGLVPGSPQHHHHMQSPGTYSLKRSLEDVSHVEL